MELALKKEMGIDVVVVLYTALLLWLLAAVGVAVHSWLVVVGIILAVLVWVSCFSIALAVVSRISVAVLIILSVAAFILLEPRQLQTQLIVATLLILFMLLSRSYIVRELSSRVKYKTRYVFGAGTNLLLMAMVVVVTGMSIPYLTETLVSDSDLLPEGTVALLLKPFEPYWKDLVPPGASVGLRSFEGQPRQVGAADVSGDIATIVASTLNDRIRSLARQYAVVTPLIIFILVTLVSRLFVLLLSVSLLPVTALLVRLARKANLLVVTAAPQPVEKLEIGGK